MTVIHCEMICDRHRSHLAQLCTGFVQLHRRGVIRLRQSYEGIQATQNWTGMWVRLGGRTLVYYDTFDGSAICEPAVERADYYFKRSYSREVAGAYDNVFPLGLNYRVLAPGLDTFRVRRTVRLLPITHWPIELFRDFIGSSALTTATFGKPPRPIFPVRVIFMAKAWDPKSIKFGGEALEELNRTRAETVLLLRKEFGALFVGGLTPNTYALRNFKDAVLLDDKAFSQRRYFTTLRDCSIGVATRGLWRSIGWKFAEYVSLAKAIVSQPLDYEVPGEFGAGRNFLEFQTPEECVEATVQLVENADLRMQLMLNNHDYYHKFLDPERLVLNTIMKAVQLNPSLGSE